LIFVLGPLFGGVGVALATNLRGLTERRVRKTFQLMQPAEGLLSRVPPWRQLLTKPIEDRIAAQVRLGRLIGLIFAAAGAFLMVLGVVIFVAWLA
jgi:hypothetical protein